MRSDPYVMLKVIKDLIKSVFRLTIKVTDPSHYIKSPNYML